MKKERKKQEEKPTLKERVARSLDASKEIVLDVPKIVFVGSREVVVENYKGILEYTDKKIVLEAKGDALRFSGSGLEIKSITRDMLFITGKIHKLELGKEESGGA